MVIKEFFIWFVIFIVGFVIGKILDEYANTNWLFTFIFGSLGSIIGYRLSKPKN